MSPSAGEPHGKSARGLGGSRKEIHRRRADEAGHEHARRVLVDSHRGTDLFGAAGVHDDHALRQRHCLDLVVRDVQARRPEAAVQLLYFKPHLDAKLGVEIRERFVEEEDLDAHDGAAHGDALALAAGELAGAPIQELGDVEDASGTLDPLLDLGIWGIS